MAETVFGLPQDGEAKLPMGDLLAHHAAVDPGKPAITYGERSISYAELDARANQQARQLAECGVGAGDTVTISMPKSIAVYEILFAVWKLGATPNIVSEKLPVAELLGIIELADPRLVIGPDPASLLGRNVLPRDLLAPENYSADPFPAQVASHWKIMTSGGSTGRPKLIVDHRESAHDPNLPVILQEAGDTVINPGPLYHNSPLTVTTHCLFTGGHVIEMDRFDPLLTLQLIERHKVTWVNFVPTMMQRIWRLPVEQRLAIDMSSLRVVFHMAAPCPIWLKEEWIAWLGPERIFELYGGTEGQGFTVISGTEWLEHKGSVGKLLPGSSLQVLDDTGNKCLPGEIGGIYFLPDTGPGSTYTYVGATAQKLGDWETLGDLGYLDEDGYLYLADRRSDLILSGGANIYPAEVEAALDAHPAVMSSIVIGLPDDDLGQRVHAIVQLAPSEPASEADLRAFLATQLVRYKIPRSFEFSAEPLRDDAGKARRTKLAADRIAAGA
ncbi:AMP-binding protein [Sphingopyxis panaciterrae]